MEPDQADLKASVEDRWGGPITAEVWAYLDHFGCVDPYEPREKAVAQIIDRLRGLRDDLANRGAAGRVLDPEHSGRSKGWFEERAYVVSSALAHIASSDPFVVEARRIMLGSEFLPGEALEEWIRASCETAASPVGEQVRLEFVVPPDRLAGAAVAQGSALADLAAISAEIARRHLWTRAQAVTFVLTGHTPLVLPVVVTFERRSPYAFRSRIHLEVDPEVSADELAQHYAEARRRQMGPRWRAQQSKALRLALVGLEYDAAAGALTWADLMHGWNQRGDVRPSERYSSDQVRNFATHCTQAARRLIDPTFTPERNP